MHGRAGLGAAVSLRPPQEDDLGFLAALRRDGELQALLLTTPDRLDDDAIRAWIVRRSTEPGGAFRVVVDTATGERVGFAQVSQVHGRNRYGYGGLALAAVHRGRGLGQAALSALVALASRDLRLRKLLAEIRSDNLASLRIHRACGYVIVGTLRHHAWIDEKAHDVLLLERSLDAVPL